MVVVDIEELKAVAARGPILSPESQRNGHAKFDLRTWVQERGVPVKREGPWQGGGYRYVLEECPWNGHTDNAAYIVQLPNGAVAAGCHHDSCRDYGWLELRRHYDPESRPLNGEGTRDGNENGRPRLRSVRFNEIPDLGPRRYLLEGLVPEGYPTLLHGDGGVAKSMLALSLGLALARELAQVKWLGRKVGKCGAVVYLDFELDAQEQRRRVMQLARGEELERVPDSFRYMSALGYPASEALRAAYEECRKHHVKLLILDSLGPALQGDAEAARDVIGFYQRELEPFRAIGVTIFIIDHQSRVQRGQNYQSKSAFGSVFKTNLARSVIQVEAGERSEGKLTVKLRQKKHNFGPPATPFGAVLTFTEEEVKVDAKELDALDLAEEQSLNAVDRIVLALKDGPAYPEELAENTGLVLKTVRNNLSRMRKAGRVEPTGERCGQQEQVGLPDPGPDKGDGTRDAEDDPPQEQLEVGL
jgi:AAA domain